MKALKKLFIIWLAFLPVLTGFFNLQGNYTAKIQNVLAEEAQVQAQVTFFNLPSASTPRQIIVWAGWKSLVH